MADRQETLSGTEVPPQHLALDSERLSAFLGSRVETATGSLTGAEAWLQILIIPLTLAFAAIAIGAVYVIVA